MAMIKSYQCVDCHYSEQLVGGDGTYASGFKTVTVSCRACLTISDANDGHAFKLELNEHQKLTCAHCDSADVVSWVDGDNCPKCDGDMRENGERLMGD